MRLGDLICSWIPVVVSVGFPYRRQFVEVKDRCEGRSENDAFDAWFQFRRRYEIESSGDSWLEEIFFVVLYATRREDISLSLERLEV